MKSIKPGRGPSKKGMVSSIAAILFSIFWCISAASMGAYIMIPFGLIAIGVSVYNLIYNYHNLTKENRYSIVDIVDEDEESDPLNEIYGRKTSANQSIHEKNGTSVSFCPYCGTSVSSEFDFCPKCGKNLPD